MKQIGELLARMELSRMALERAFNRYLTPIAISMALIGIAVVIAGLVRAAWTNHSATTIDDKASLIAQTPASLVVLTRQPIAFTTIPDRPRKSMATYTVKSCDTLLGIANKFGISTETILWSNSILDNNTHLLQPGMNVGIPPADGLYYVADGNHSLQWIADAYQVDVNAIINSEFDDLAGFTPTDLPDWGRKIFIHGGQQPEIDPPIVSLSVIDKKTGMVIQGFMPGMGGSCPAKAFTEPSIEN
jgi:LysM repeat protein